MITAALSPDEEGRVGALRRYGILDTPDEPAFDDLATLASRICAAPISLISFIDTRRQWFKACIGLDVRETSRDIAFCAHTILGRDPLIVEDALADERFADNPLVLGHPHIRFYAGAPLISPDGHVLGTICVIDTVPRRLDGAQIDSLRILARQVVAQLELGNKVGLLSDAVAEQTVIEQRLRASEEHYRTIIDNAPDVIYRTDASGHFSFVNVAAIELMGYDESDLLGRSFLDLIGPADRQRAERFYLRQFARRIPSTYFEFVAVTRDGREVHFGQNVLLLRDDDDVIGFQAVARDITAQRRMEQALRESEERYRDLFDNANDLIYSVDRKGCFIYVNKSWRDAFGYGDDELERMTIMDLLDPEFKASESYDVMAREWVAAIDRGESLGSVTLEFRTREGEPLVLDGHINPRVEGGVVVATRGIFRDVTERRRAERQLQETLTLQRAILESSAYMIVSTDADGVIQTWNRAAERLLGYSAEEVVGKASPMLIHDPVEVGRRAAQLSEELGREVAPGKDAFVAKARLGVPDEAEWTYIARSGRRFPVLLVMTAIVDASGEITGYLGMASDITERKRIEQALRHSQDQVRNAFEFAPIGIALVALDGRWLQVNRALVQIIGYREEELLHSTFQAITHPDDLDLDLEYLHRLLAGTIDSYRLEKRYYHRDGHIVWALLNVSLVRTDDGRPDYFIAQIQDVTERRRMDEDLAAARDAALESARLKSEFLANMSHEIRTPMNGIIGMTGLLLDTSLSAQQREYGEIIESSAKGLLTIINDILDFSKIDAGKLDVEEVDLEVGGLIAGVCELLADRARGKGIELTFSVDPEIPQPLRGDPVRVRQILTNLVGNAVKFTDAGSVEIHAEMLAAGPETVDVHFVVRDTGIGLSRDAAARLFNPFMQADSSMTRRYGGTGLGLVISKRLVEMMGGTIGVESAPGTGSTFWFIIPFVRPQGAVAPAHQERARSIRGGESGGRVPLRILVAEDNVVNQKVTLGQLKKLGYEADVVATGVAALEAHERNHYDLILMDCQMPEMDGYRATEEIRRREEPSAGRTTIIALTANAMEGARERCMAAGMDSYISKPVDMEQLAGVLHRVVESRADDPRFAEPDSSAGNPSTEGPSAKGVSGPDGADARDGLTSGVTAPEEAREARQIEEIPADMLDTGVLADLRALDAFGDSSLLDELIDLFMDEAPAKMRELRAAHEAGDVRMAEHVAHKLSGSSSVLGARRLAPVLQDIERRCATGAVADLAPLVAEAARELDFTIRALAGHRNGRQDGA